MFRGSFYEQTDGVAVGSPLVPVLQFIHGLNEYKGPSVLLYRRDVDDTFCLFHNESDASQFFN